MKNTNCRFIIKKVCEENKMAKYIFVTGGVVSSLGKELNDEYKKKFINKELNVLIESYDKKTSLYHGLSENYLDCYIKSDTNIINTFVKYIYH